MGDDAATPPEDVVLRPVDDSGSPESGTVRGALPGVELPDMTPATGTELAEGSTIVDAQGIVIQLTSGGWAFVPDRDASGEADPPMVLQPAQRTAEMIRLVTARADTVTFRLSGEIHRYRGRHYLLPARFEVIVDDRGSERAPAEERAAEAERALEAAGDVTADELADRIAAAEAREGDRPSSITTATNTSEGPEGFDANLLTEGTMLVDRAGRIERTGGGLWDFVSDNDADVADEDRAELEGPITLTPCLTLEALERELTTSATRAKLTVTGRVFVFEGKNYMLLTMYRFAPDVGGNLTTAQ